MASIFKFSYISYTREKFDTTIVLLENNTNFMGNFNPFGKLFQGLAWFAHIHGMGAQHISKFTFVLIITSIPIQKWWKATPLTNSQHICFFQNFKIGITTSGGCVAWIITPFHVVGLCMFSCFYVGWVVNSFQGVRRGFQVVCLWPPS